MYVEKTTAEERLTIDHTVGGLFATFEIGSNLLQDVIETSFKYRDNKAECKVEPDLLYNRLWVINDLMFNILLQYHLIMGDGEYGAVQAHIEGVDTARKAIAEEDALRQAHRRKLEMRVDK